MIKKILVLLILYSSNIFSQNLMIKGKVSEVSGDEIKPLFGANIYVMNSSKGTISDSNGKFQLVIENSKDFYLIASFVGYFPDTIKISKIENVEFFLKPMQLMDVDILSMKKSNFKSKLDIKNLEVITNMELEKSACCNLSQSFETNPSVDVVVRDGVLGTKKVQMLGLDGIYSQILLDNKPLVRGLSNIHGLNFIPGAWIESISIVKGSGSVTEGYESISGQINVKLFKPTNKKILLNSYLNHFGDIENNLVFSKVINNNWNTSVLIHSSINNNPGDQNRDTFIDVPEKNLNTFLLSFERQTKKSNFYFGYRGASELKKAGQIRRYNPMISRYKVKFDNDQQELFSKLTLNFKSNKVLELNINYINENIVNNFGENLYDANQMSGYFNSIYNTNIFDMRNELRVGASYYLDSYDEFLDRNNIELTNLNRTDHIFGAFAEVQRFQLSNLSILIGNRLDYFLIKRGEKGIKFSPRINLKYDHNQKLIFKINASKAHRIFNFIPENLSYLYSTRSINFSNYNELDPESSSNYGFSILTKFKIFNKDFNLDFDYNFIDFQNQIIIDLEESNKINIYNSYRSSFASNIQVNLDFEVSRSFEVKFSQKFNTSKSYFKIEDRLVQKYIPFIPKNRKLLQFYYYTWQNKYSTSLTIQNIGSMRVPSQGDISEFWSDRFNLISLQVTRKFKNLDVYLGIENILNFRQKNPIRSFENPYSDNFDASMIWGPVVGRIAYFGIRKNFN